MQITIGQMVLRYYGRELRPIVGMVVANELDTWTVEWYDRDQWDEKQNCFQIRYETSTIRGYAMAYNKLRKNLK